MILLCESRTHTKFEGAIWIPQGALTYTDAPPYTMRVNTAPVGGPARDSGRQRAAHAAPAQIAESQEKRTFWLRSLFSRAEPRSYFRAPGYDPSHMQGRNEGRLSK